MGVALNNSRRVCLYVPLLLVIMFCFQFWNKASVFHSRQLNMFKYFCSIVEISSCHKYNLLYIIFKGFYYMASHFDAMVVHLLTVNGSLSTSLHTNIHFHIPAHAYIHIYIQNPSTHACTRLYRLYSVWYSSFYTKLKIILKIVHF